LRTTSSYQELSTETGGGKVAYLKPAKIASDIAAIIASLDAYLMASDTRQRLGVAGHTRGILVTPKYWWGVARSGFCKSRGRVAPLHLIPSSVALGS
jgi:hypothetical protein